MFFKRSNGEFRETDRVTRFKLIKSGKNWLRASTSNFGLLKVIRGQVEETIVAEVREDAGMTGRSFLKGAAVAVAVLSLASFVNTSYADELGKDEVVTSAVVSTPAVSTPAVASEPAALNEQDSKEVVGTLNESATETPASTTPSSELVETVPASDDKTILEQNASEAALLNKIAEKYASNHQNTEQKEAINDAVAKVQSELTAGDKLTATDATAQTYADQRERLSKSVDDMMATLTAAGFEGNTTVNGAPAISAQLDALSTSNTLTAPSVSPTMDQPNGASIEDPAWNNANYKLDPNADRYTYSIWDLQNWAGPANQGGFTYSNGGYYVTFSVDRSTVGTTTTPVVHARLVEKTTGKEVETLDITAKSIYQFKTLVQANPTYAPQFDYTTGEASQILGTWTNNREAGPTSDNKYKHHILQIRDTVKPGNVGETKPNVQTVIPIEKVTHTTHYKVEGTNEELASYSQTGIESQAYKASNPRSFEGYEFVRTDAEKDMSGFLGGVGAKYLELQGGRAHYYVKRIIEQVDKDGTSVVKLYALDPSKVSSYNPSTDVNTLDLTNYTLLYTSDPVKPGGKPTPAGTATEPREVGYVDSKDGKYRLKVATYTDGGNGNVRLSGWYNKATGDAFTGSPQFSTDVDPVRNNTSNIIGGNTPGDKASGYPSFFNNYSLPSIKQISTDVTHYYRKSDVKGNVYVHYKDTEGTTIKNSVTVEEQQPINKHYETQDRRPQDIEFQGKTYELVPAGAYKVGEVDEEGHLKSSDPTTGEVAKEDKNVTYIYKLKEKPKGEVVITYVDEKGKEIQKPRQDTPNSPYDTPYNTTEKGEKPNFIKAEDGKTYKIVPKGDYPVGKVDENGHLEKSDPVTGKVTKPKSTITYVYKEVNGNVYVHYVDTEGKTIKEDVTAEKAQPVDKDYNTVKNNRPQEIEFEGNTYELVPAGKYTAGEVDEQGHLKSTDPTTGKVIEGDKNVTYVYKLKEGEVVITYVDVNGKEIQKPRQDTPNSPYDTPYDTTQEGEKPNTIKSEDGKTYKIVPKGDYPVGKVDENGHLEKSDPIKGKVTKPKSTITYVYKEEPKGNVYVHYVDTEGKTIKSDVTDEDAQPVDKDYDTVVDNRPQEITFEGKTYELVPAGKYTVGEVDDQGHLKSTDPTTGKVIEGDKNVTYVYKLKEGEVVITYVDVNGKEIQKPRQDTPNSPYDTPYDTTQEGEKPNTIKSEDGKTYKIVPKGDYPVGKVDENGHLEKSDPIKGKVTKPKSTITYVYKEEPKGNVYVHYVDTEGKTIKSDVTDEDAQPVDKDYDTVVDNRPQEITFEGKTYELVPAGKYTVGEVDDQGHLKSTDPTTGKVIEGDKNVTYVYKLKEGEVVITYVDVNGKEIQKPRQDTPNSPYDTPYDTTQEGEKPNTIKSEDGKTYKIVPKGDYPVGKVDENGHLEKSDPIKGKVTKPKSTITYVYKEEPKGNVYVHYVDTEGKTIKSDVTDEDAQPVDKDYDTVVDNRPQEITFEGKTYELVPAGKYTVGEVDDQGHLKSTDPTTGKVIEGDKNVTYVYKLKEEPVAPKGNVYVHYVDTEGKTIKSDVTDEDAQPVDKDYDTVVDNRPQEITFEGKTYELVPAGKYTVGEVDDQGHLKSTDPTTGKVIEGDKNVTYVYKLKEEPVAPKGNVYVHYVDTEGKTIKSDVTDEDAQPVDKDYDTVVDNRPQEIEFEGKTYELVPAGKYTVGEVDDQGHLKSTDPTTGKVIEGDKNVTYVYKLKEEPVAPKGNVYVHYVDTEGKTIKSDVTDEDAQPVDKDYDTVVDNRPQEITFEGKTYELVPAGKYTVGEVDDQGHLKSTDPTTGKVIEGDKNVTYVYKLKEEPVAPKGNVYVHYVDTEGKTIKSDVTDEDAQPVDKDYDTVVDNRPQEIEFEGKTYELVPAGKYTVGEVDDQGHLKSTDPTTGKVIEGDKNVTYVYKLKEEPVAPKGNVYVHYVDTEGKTIKSDVTDEDAQPVDKDYDTVVDNRPQEITFEGKTYELVPAGKYTVGEVDDQGHLKSTDPTTGKVIEGDKNVTYVYKLKEEPVAPKGNVYVHYVDTEGKTIKSDVTDEDAQPVDKDYDTVVDNRPQEIEFEGKTYELVPAGKYTVGEVDDQGHLKSTDPTTGKVIEGDKNVTYVYKLKETPDKPVEPTPDKPVEPTPDKPVEPTPDKPVEPTPDKPVEPTPDKPVDPTPDKPVEPTPDKPVEPTPDKPVEPTPDKPVEPTPDKPVEPTPDKPVEPTPDKPVEPTPDKPVEPTPDKPVEPTPDKPVEPTPDKPVEPTPDKPVEPTPDKPVEPTPDKPVEPTPDKPVEPTPDKPVEPTPDKPVEPTPDKPVEPTPDKPVEPTPDKPVEPTPDKPVDPTPDKPVEPTPDKPVEPTPDKPVEPTPDKPVDPTPDKPVEPTPDKPVDPTPDKPVDPTPGKPVNPTPGKPVNPTPGKPVNPTPGKPVNPTPGKPVNPTPGKPVDPTPGKPVDPTPGKPVEPTPGKPVDPTPGKPVNPTPGKPVDPTPGKPVNPTPSKPVSEQPAKPTSAKAQLPNTGETKSAGSTVLGVVAGLVGLAALGRRKKEDEK